MIVERFRPEHFENLMLQPAQEYMRPSVSRREYAEALAEAESYAYILDGRVVACCGLVPLWEGRSEAWALISRDIGPKGMHALHYKVRNYLDAATIRRIEACCDAAYKQAHRWLDLLGFDCEGPLRKYSPEGRDCLRFARVR